MIEKPTKEQLTLTTRVINRHSKRIDLVKRKNAANITNELFDLFGEDYMISIPLDKTFKGLKAKFTKIIKKHL